MFLTRDMFVFILSVLVLGLIVGFFLGVVVWAKDVTEIFLDDLYLPRRFGQLRDSFFLLLKSLPHFFYNLFYKRFRLPKLKEKMKEGGDAATWALADRLIHTKTTRKDFLKIGY